MQNFLSCRKRQLKMKHIKIFKGFLQRALELSTAETFHKVFYCWCQTVKSHK